MEQWALANLSLLGTFIGIILGYSQRIEDGAEQLDLEVLSQGMSATGVSVT